MKYRNILICALSLAATPALAAGTLSFSEIDTDGDGRISADEASAADLSFAAMDIDADGEISVAEFDAAGMPANASGAVGTLSFSEIDTDGDGRISGDEASAAKLSFAAMDTDGDGEVSVAEFDAAGMPANISSASSSSSDASSGAAGAGAAREDEQPHAAFLIEVDGVVDPLAKHGRRPVVVFRGAEHDGGVGGFQIGLGGIQVDAQHGQPRP